MLFALGKSAPGRCFSLKMMGLDRMGEPNYPVFQSYIKAAHVPAYAEHRLRICVCVCAGVAVLAG